MGVERTKILTVQTSEEGLLIASMIMIVLLIAAGVAGFGLWLLIKSLKSLERLKRKRLVWLVAGILMIIALIFPPFTAYQGPLMHGQFIGYWPIWNPPGPGPYRAIDVDRVLLLLEWAAVGLFFLIIWIVFRD